MVKAIALIKSRREFSIEAEIPLDSKSLPFFAFVPKNSYFPLCKGEEHQIP